MPQKEDKVLEEIKRHNKVLMEHMEQQVKIVAEQHGSIVKKLEEHDGQFENLKGEINQLRNSMERHFDSLENTFGAVLHDHEGRIKKVEEKIGA